MELLGQVNSADNLSQGAENLLQTLIDSFVENVTIGAAHLAMHRGSTAIKPEDVLLYLGLLRPFPTLSPRCALTSRPGAARPLFVLTPQSKRGTSCCPRQKARRSS